MTTSNVAGKTLWSAAAPGCVDGIQVEENAYTPKTQLILNWELRSTLRIVMAVV